MVMMKKKKKKKKKKSMLEYIKDVGSWRDM